MTLHINIKKATNLPSDRGFLFVEGSQAGVLQSEKIYNEENLVFQIMCSSKDHLHFKYCNGQSQYENGEIIAAGQFHIESFIRKNDASLKSDQPFATSVILFDSSSKEAGELNLELTLDRTRSYQGELSTSSQRKTIHKINLYKSKVPQKNLFSMFDPALKESQDKWMESIYRDEE